MLHQGRQAYNIEIQLEIVNQIVRFIVQLPVDIGEQGADFVQLHGILQHIDQDDAGKLAAGVPLALRRGHKAPADPVLDDIGLQPGQAGHLGEHQPPGQKEGVQQGLRLLRSVPVHRDGGSRQRLCHIIHSFSCFDMIILNNHMIVNGDLKIIY